MTDDWVRVVYASDCTDADINGEVLICPNCHTDYAECPCPGPHQDDEYDYVYRGGILYARRREGA